MNGGSRRRVTIIPLSAPTAVPHASAASTPRGTLPVDLNTDAAMHALTPTFAPIDRSMPAPIITSVAPDAIRNTRLACRRTLRRFDAVRNPSVKNASARHTDRMAQTRYASARASAEATDPAAGAAAAVTVMRGP